MFNITFATLVIFKYTIQWHYLHPQCVVQSSPPIHKVFSFFIIN